MSVQVVRETRDLSMESIGVNGCEAKVLINLDTPEVDSLGEDIVALRAYGVPDQVVSGMLRRLREAIALNSQEGQIEWAIAGNLDQLARPAGVPTVGLTVKQLARVLRPALATLANPAGADARSLVAAAALVASTTQRATMATLRSHALRHELRPTSHDQLLQLVDGAS